MGGIVYALHYSPIILDVVMGALIVATYNCLKHILKYVTGLSVQLIVQDSGEAEVAEILFRRFFRGASFVEKRQQNRSPVFAFSVLSVVAFSLAIHLIPLSVSNVVSKVVAIERSFG